MARLGGDEAVRLFGEYQRRRNLSPRTVKARWIVLRALRDWLDKDMLDATTADLEKWLDSTDKAPQTRYTYIAFLSAFYGWAHKQRIIRKDPAENMIRPKLPKRVPRPWDDNDFAHAFAEADDRMRCFLLLIHMAGARCMEVAAVQADDIHRDQGVILLHGKGDKERLVPIHPVLMDALTAYGIPRAGYLFRRRDGKPLSASTVSRYVNTHLRACDSAATAHMGRHSFGTRMYRLSKGDLRMVQDVMGHSSPASTAIYTAWAPERSAKIVGQLTLPGLRDNVRSLRRAANG